MFSVSVPGTILGTAEKTDNFVYDKERKGHKGYFRVYTHSHKHTHTEYIQSQTRARTHVRGPPQPNENMTAAAATPSGLNLQTLMITATVSPTDAGRPTIWLWTLPYNTRAQSTNIIGILPIICRQLTDWTMNHKVMIHMYSNIFP